jgi:LAO/AO transport system kinase
MEDPKFRYLALDVLPVTEAQTLSTHNIDSYVEGILKGDVAILGRAITLVESSLAGDSEAGSLLIKRLIPQTGKSLRLAITGVPGVGKSTFIEVLGKHLTSLGKRVAVLAIDPSSPKTRGSILGDKTRMEELAKDPSAFVRPTSARGHLGGVGGRTREAILLCEAAGYNVIIVETVGVGQSETKVRDMVDYLLLLMLAGAGDELQGVKKGILEMSDLIVINKCDGENIGRVAKAKSELQQAFHMLAIASGTPETRVLTASSTEHQGINEIWQHIQGDCNKRQEEIAKNRKEQNHLWMEDRLQGILHDVLSTSARLQARKKELDKSVRDGLIYPPDAANELWSTLRGDRE